MRIWIPLVLVAALAVLGASEALTPPPADPAPTSVPDAPLAAPDGRGDLVVTALAPDGASGRVAFALYDSERAFRGEADPLRKAFVDIGEGGRALWRIEGLVCGTYAVKAYHDANGNQALDKGAFGVPTEPYAFSRNARGRFGPPAYDDARFTLGEGALALEVRLTK